MALETFFASQWVSTNSLRVAVINGVQLILKLGQAY